MLFYCNRVRIIPHAFGRLRPPGKFNKNVVFGFTNEVINTHEILRNKYQLMEALVDVEVASKIICGAHGESNILDQYYKSLNTDIQPVELGTEEWEMVQQ